MAIKGTPERWSAPGAYRIEGAAVTGWVQDFGEPLLVELADGAVSDNFSLGASLQRVFQAEERARVTRSNLFPKFDEQFSSTRSQTVGPAGKNRSTRHNLTLGMSWEVDLWGQLRDLKRADVALMDASFHAYQAARLSLVALVLQTAFELVESRGQIELARRNLESLETVLEILDAKLEGGDADDRTALEISLARADVARAESTIIAEQRQTDLSRRLLETLLGRYPLGVLEGLGELPDPGRKVPAGMPSDLLMRRPDILQAEMTVNSALYGVAATRKQLLPSLRLTGDLGTTSRNPLKDLLDVENLIWNITQNLTQPVFRAGEIRAEIRLSEFERDQLIAEYADVVLTAFREVETALAAEEFFDEQVVALRRNVREARLAEELSLSQYEKGLVEIITVLESQRRAFDAESSLLNVRLLRLLNRVDLHLALGGDFATPAVCVADPSSGEGLEKPGWMERLRAPKRP